MRLLALGRPACFSLCCAALSLSLVRYCCSVRPAVRVTCLSLPGTMPMFSHLVISSYRRAVPSCVSCLLAARLSIISSHLLARRLACRLPVLRHGWAGREAGSVGVLLAWFCPAVCVGVDSWLMVFPLRCPIPWSACLSARLRGDGVLISSVRDVWRCPCLSPAVSSRPSPRPSSRRSGRFCVSRPVLRHDGRGGGRLRLANRLSL